MSAARINLSGLRRPAAGITLADGRLTQLRTQRGWSREQLAVAAQLSVSMITKMENGERRPRSGKFSDLCTALDCQPEDLLPEL